MIIFIGTHIRIPRQFSSMKSIRCRVAAAIPEYHRLALVQLRLIECHAPRTSINVPQLSSLFTRPTDSSRARFVLFALHTLLVGRNPWKHISTHFYNVFSTNPEFSLLWRSFIQGKAVQPTNERTTEFPTFFEVCIRALNHIPAGANDLQGFLRNTIHWENRCIQM